MNLSQQRMCVFSFNNLSNMLQKEEKTETGEKYPMLDKTNERKYM